MKIFAFLFALFFAVLTVVPCSDTAKGFGEKVCLAQDIHLEQSAEGHADFCTPFCVCNCCGISMTVTQLAGLLPERPFLSFQGDRNERKYTYSLLYSAGIWQPPKGC